MPKTDTHDLTLPGVPGLVLFQHSFTGLAAKGLEKKKASQPTSQLDSNSSHLHQFALKNFGKVHELWEPLFQQASSSSD